jgi:hypothetical protein
MSYWQLFHYECDAVGCTNKVTLVSESCASTKTPKQIAGAVDVSPRSPQPQGWKRVVYDMSEIDLCPSCGEKLPEAIGHER